MTTSVHFGTSHTKHVKKIMSDEMSLLEPQTPCRCPPSFPTTNHSPSPNMNMLEFWWKAHYDLFETCDSKAQDLVFAVTAAVKRVIKQDNRSARGADHVRIKEMYHMLNVCQEFAHEAQAFCRKMAKSNKGYGKTSPFDTQPASNSEYAWIPQVKGEVPVSPMRAMWQLQSFLEKGMRDVSEL